MLTRHCTRVRGNQAAASHGTLNSTPRTPPRSPSLSDRSESWEQAVEVEEVEAIEAAETIEPIEDALEVVSPPRRSMSSASSASSPCSFASPTSADWEHVDAASVPKSTDTLGAAVGARPLDVASSSRPWTGASSDGCAICCNAARTYALIPCGHHCLCERCIGSLDALGRLCPICREPAFDTLRVYDP